ncbi:MAG: hypothetical protein R3C97_19665, partial [Geminicoccaceae bacterium]
RRRAGRCLLLPFVACVLQGPGEGSEGIELVVVDGKVVVALVVLLSVANEQPPKGGVIGGQAA